MKWRNPKEMTKKPFVHPLRDSSTPADLRLRPLLGAFRTSGAVPSGLLGQPLCKYELMLEAIPSTSLWRASTLAQPM